MTMRNILMVAILALIAVLATTGCEHQIDKKTKDQANRLSDTIEFMRFCVKDELCMDFISYTEKLHDKELQKNKEKAK